MKFIHFLMQHWLLSAAFLIVFVLLMIEEYKAQKSNISVTSLVKLLNDEQVTVIDVRDAKLYAAGHIAKAINIPFANLKTDVELESLRENVVIVGKSSIEEQSAGRVLAKLGRAECSFLQGGMGAWEKANMPLVRGNAKQKGNKHG